MRAAPYAALRLRILRAETLKEVFDILNEALYVRLFSEYPPGFRRSTREGKLLSLAEIRLEALGWTKPYHVYPDGDIIGTRI